MVDAHAVDAAAFRQARHQAVRGLEHRAVLHAQAGEIGDLEEAPVVDLVGRDAPERKPVVLLLEQAVQRERVLGGGLQADLAFRVEREAVVEVAHAPLARLAVALDLQLLQRFAVVLAEHRQQQLAARPIDVEELGIGRGAAFFQHVEPPGVVGVQHAHVVRHQVHHHAHAVLFQGGDELVQLFLGADLRVDRVVVDHVVAVRAAGARFEERRRIEMADAKAGEVRHQLDRVLEAEILVELQPVRGDGHDQRRALGHAALGHRLPQRRDPRVGAPALERERQLATPVGMLVDRPRQVRLLEQLEHVLRLQHGELRRRARDEGMGRLRRAVDDLRELFLLAFPAFHFLLEIHREAELLAQREIRRVPVAAPRRQVVRAHADQRLARIGLRRTELALRVLLEQQRPVGKHAGFIQRAAQFGGDGAEVLADHQAARAAAFRGQHREQLAERVVHVAAALRLRALRNPPQARERHDVIHAQRPAHRHVGAQQIDERPVRLRAQRARRIRRQPPVLAARIELVGRRAARGVHREGVLVGPHLRPAAIRAEREVHVETERHAELLRMALHLLELSRARAAAARHGTPRDRHSFSRMPSPPWTRDREYSCGQLCQPPPNFSRSASNTG